MKKIKLLALSLCSICLIASAQTPPRLSIAKDSSTSAQINWTNIAGTSYRLWFTESLAPISWTPLEDAFSEDTNVSVSVSTTDMPTGFFRVQIPTNGTLPAVRIFSPTNNQIVSGTIAVGVGAQITNQLQGVNLYLDDALVGFIDSGGIKFDLDTSHFANGSHTLYVTAVDTANNEVSSSTITLDFENSVRWLDADTLFQSFVPISVESDIFPADWSVFVEDTNGVTIRTFSGTTLDGIIQTSWDGTDDSSVAVADEALYKITIAVASQSFGNFSMMSSSSLAESSSASSVNNVGQVAPDPMTAYSELLENYSNAPDNIKMIYPPLPPPPSLVTENSTTVKEMSPLETFMSQHGTSNARTVMFADSPSGSGGSSGSTGGAVWREAPWNSAQTVLARVPISGSFGTVVQNFFLQLRDLIVVAEDTVGNNRGVFGNNSIYVLQSSGDLSDLTNNLANPNARALYFYGHGNTNGNVISTTTAGIRAKDLGALLGNSYKPFKNGPLTIITHKPFSFVFLDGCNTGLGNFPEAFGIPKVATSQSYENYHKHKRAFMGWGGVVTFQFSTPNFDWSQKFWSKWLDDTEAYIISLHDAVEAANQYRPSATNSTPMMIYGSQSLTWTD